MNDSPFFGEDPTITTSEDIPRVDARLPHAEHPQLRAKSAESANASRRLLIGMGAAAIATAIALSVIPYFLPFGRPASFLKAMTPALAKGDLRALSAEPRLGLKDRLDNEVRARGTNEYQRILAIHDRVQALGSAEFDKRLAAYRSALQEAARLGQQAFDALPEASRWRIWTDGIEKEVWLYANARDEVREKYKEVLPDDGAFLEDDTARRELEFAECKGAASPEQLSLIEKVIDKPTLLEEDPFYADMLKGCLDAARKRIDRAETKVRSAIGKLERRSTPRPEVTGALEREQAKAGELGKGALSPERRQVLDAYASYENMGASTKARTQRTLGEEQLTSKEMADLDTHGHDRAAFEASRDQFIDTQGRALETAFLRDTFSACHGDVGDVTPYGLAKRSLLRSLAAVVEVKWSSDACRQWAGGVFNPTYDKGRWVLAVPDEEQDEAIHVGLAAPMHD